MFLHDCLQDIEERCGDHHFLRPDYRRYSFAQIPALIEILLGVRTGEHPFAPTVLRRVNPRPQIVVLFLIDGFGCHQWLAYAQLYPFFRNFIQRGTVMPVTAVFPSTTAASVTTINSGLTPQEHGLLDYRLYFEEVDDVIITLPFTLLTKEERSDLLLEHGVDPRILFNGTSLHARLRQQGIASHTVLHNSYAHSAYSKISQAGATVIPYGSAPEMLVLLRQRLAAANSRTYFYVYWNSIDHISHVYSPHSECYFAELNSLAYLLQSEFLNKLDRKVAENTVLLVTADHGHVPMDPDETVYLNDMAPVMNSLARSTAGKIILPWGSPRDIFLTVQEEKLEEVIGYLSDRLVNKATVRKSQEEADNRLFGYGPEHPQFRKRIGNVLILAHEGHTLGYQYPGLEKSAHRGMHGGLSREEMTTVLAFANASEVL